MNDVTSSDIGPAFSPEEEAFFSSGGESVIPDTGSDSAGGELGGDAGKVDPPEVPGADKDGKGGDKVEKMVSLSALHEERTKRQARDTENRKLALELAELKGKFSVVERLNLPVADGTQDNAPKAPPTPEEDIFGAVKHTGETVAQLAKRLDDADAVTKASSEQAAFVNSYKEDAAKFEVTKPDYRQAYDFILKSRAAELQAIGYDTPQALHEALNADEFAIAQMAFSKGKSPAEMLYALATQRGYKPAAAAPKPGEEPAPGKGAEKLDAIERGQAANKSLSNLGGEAPGAEMTGATLLAMPLPEFTEWCEKNPAKAKRIMGG